MNVTDTNLELILNKIEQDFLRPQFLLARIECFMIEPCEGMGDVIVGPFLFYFIQPVYPEETERMQDYMGNSIFEY